VLEESAAMIHSEVSLAFVNYDVPVGWGWIACATGFLVVYLGLVACGRRFRLRLLAISSLVLLVAVVCLWFRSRIIVDQVGLRYSTAGTPQTLWHFGLGTHMGKMSVYLEESAATSPITAQLGWRGYWVTGTPTGARANNVWGVSDRIAHPLHLQGLGFEVLIHGDARVPGKWVLLHEWGLLVPDWFVVACLLLFPGWWAFSRWRLPRRRMKLNLCVCCGYPLRGLEEPIRCPECGKAKSEVKCRSPREP
jgi:hypothetical protein